MINLLKFPIDIWLAIGLIVVAAGVVLLNSMGLLPKKSLPYVLLAVGSAFGIAWISGLRRRKLREQLKAEEERLKQLEGRLGEAGKGLDAAEVRLSTARATFDARRKALEESAVEIDEAHRQRLKEIANLSDEQLDDEMTALLVRLPEGR